MEKKPGLKQGLAGNYSGVAKMAQDIINKCQLGGGTKVDVLGWQSRVKGKHIVKYNEI